ncbi:MAG: hypothetical protein IMZ50_01330 [Candidatus Atribacteria bacterium]|nr:hypothetical protein [Candidatus Atribacteria bacterium]
MTHVLPSQEKTKYLSHGGMWVMDIGNLEKKLIVYGSFWWPNWRHNL